MCGGANAPCKARLRLLERGVRNGFGVVVRRVCDFRERRRVVRAVALVRRERDGGVVGRALRVSCVCACLRELLPLHWAVPHARAIATE